MSQEVDTLAHAIAGKEADPSRLAQAREIAEAQFDLGRVQSVKVALLDSQFSGKLLSRDIETGIAGRSQHAHAVASVEDASHGTQPRHDFGLTDVLHQLERLTRYESQAILRRRRAMRAFVLHQIGGAAIE